MTQAAADDIEYNTMGEFQTNDCNTHGYYIVKWTGNAYTRGRTDKKLTSTLVIRNF